MGVTVARAAVVVTGVLLLIGGVALAAVTGPAGFVVAALTFFSGAVLLVGASIERLRYRSLRAEHSGAAPGPGGGEPVDAPLEARFRPTPEVFHDPTTGVRLRVFVDQGTGDRRYVPEASPSVAAAPGSRGG